MSTISIFEKGNYRQIPDNFRTSGICALQELTKFQHEFKSYDTDTTINEIRDSIVANYLGYDLLNFEKHGFDAKKSSNNKFLEVKQCSVSSRSWGGTWNDTNEEKAIAFSDERLFTVVGIWKGAADLQFMVYGQHVKLGEYLLERVRAVANTSTRSTQSISITKMIKDYNFKVISPPDKSKKEVFTLLCNKYRNIINDLALNEIKNYNEI